MLRCRFCVAFVALLGFAITLAPAARRVEISLGKSIEIGRQELLFGSVVSICEDNEQNFYVLDSTEFRVLKFSPEGRLLLKFGQKGQGPGDFQSPHLVVISPRAEVLVLENFTISFFKPDGTFARRQELNGRLGLVYLGPNRFLAWDWYPDSRQQIMLDGQNSIVATFHAQPRDSFSTTLSDERGRQVMFNYASDVYVPELLFGYCGGVGLVGISNLYDLSLLDENGRAIGSVKRDLKPGRISGKEKSFLEENIRDYAKARNWPAHAVRDLVNKIPAFKAIIRAVRVSPLHVFVFRVPEDVRREVSATPVDVFSLRGEFLGSTVTNKIPLHISGRAMYFVEADDSGNEYLRRTGYSFSVK
jgi:hypothetical protein